MLDKESSAKCPACDAAFTALGIDARDAIIAVGVIVATHMHDAHPGHPLTQRVDDLLAEMH